MSNFDFDDFLENPHQGKTWNAKNDFSNDFNDIHNQAKEADKTWKNRINHDDSVNNSKEFGSNWNNNLDSNMKSLANNAKTVCNILLAAKKKQYETVAENIGMITKVINQNSSKLYMRVTESILIYALYYSKYSN